MQIATVRRIITMTAWVAYIGAVAFAATVIFLDLVDPDFHPFFDYVSDLAIGRYGILLTFAFVLHGGAMSMLGPSLHWGLAATSSKRTANAILLVGGVCIMLLAVFPPDGPGAEPTLTGRAHLALAFGGFVLLAVASWLFSRLARDEPNWPWRGWIVTFVSIFIWLSLAVFVAAFVARRWIPDFVLGDYVGAAERLVVFATLWWIVIVSHRLRVLARDPDHFIQEGDRVRVRVDSIDG